MKKILFTLFLALIGQQIFASAGGDKYVKAMQQAMGLMDEAKSIEEYTNAANRFERIGNAEKKEWLPYYYASLCYAIMVFQEKDPDQMDAILDRAEKILEKAEDMKLKDHEKSEVLVVKGMIAAGRIQVDPQVRSMTYGPLSSQLYARASSLNTDNPRALSMAGQSTMYTPKQFGGGREKAIPMLESSVTKFDSWEAPDELFPTWGKEMAEGILKFAKSGEKAAWEEESDQMEEGADKEKEGASDDHEGHDHGDHDGHDHDGTDED